MLRVNCSAYDNVINNVHLGMSTLVGNGGHSRGISSL